VRPKPLLRVAGRYIYEYTLELVSEVRHHLSDAVIVMPKGDYSIGVLPTWARIVEQEGSGVEAALETGLRAVKGDSEVIVSFTGYLVKPPYIVKLLLDYYSSVEYPLVVSVSPITSGLETFGFIDIGLKGEVKSVSREPRPEWLGGRGYVFAGVLIGERSFIEILSERGFMDGLNMLASKGLVGALTWTGDWVEIGYPWDLFNVSKLIVADKTIMVSENASLGRTAIVSGPVIISDKVEVREGAIVSGPCYIGEDTVIGEGSVIGPNVVIGGGVVVEPLTVVRNSVILDNAWIGSHSILDYVVVGDGVRIGRQVVTEPSKPVDAPSWIMEAVEKAGEDILLGGVIGPRATVDHRALLRASFIE